MKSTGGGKKLLFFLNYYLVKLFFFFFFLKAQTSLVRQSFQWDWFKYDSRYPLNAYVQIEHLNSL